MGCNAGKNVRVEEINIKEAKSNGILDNNRSASLTRTTISSIEDELDSATVNIIQKAANGMSFEIKFDDEQNDESIIQKHPPKRILELQEPQSNNPTLENIQEKLEEAEIRRLQILQQRIKSSKQKISTKASSESIYSDNSINVLPNRLTVPTEVVSKSESQS